MFIVVLLAVFAAAESATRNASNEAERNEALSEETTGISRMITDLRGAYQVNYPTHAKGSEKTALTSDKIDVLARLRGVGARRVFISCEYKEPNTSYDECVLYESSETTGFTAGTAPSGVSPQVLVPRVLNETSEDSGDPVFQAMYTPSEAGGQPTYGEIVIHTPSKGSLSGGVYKHQVELRDSFYLHNLDYGET